MIGRFLPVLLTLAYPILVFATISYWSIQGLGWVILALGTIRLASFFLIQVRKSDTSPAVRLQGGLMLLLGSLILLTESTISARIYPVVVNLCMLGWFGWSLIYPPSIIERVVRLTETDLPTFATNYMRRVTLIWCGFFSINASLALYTALFSSLEVWTLYNGLVAYLLMGALFGIEYVVRQRVRSAHGNGID